MQRSRWQAEAGTAPLAARPVDQLAAAQRELGRLRLEVALLERQLDFLAGIIPWEPETRQTAGGRRSWTGRLIWQEGDPRDWARALLAEARRIGSGEVGDGH